MITAEQLKNLKPGDTILVEAKFNNVTATGADVTYGCISRPLSVNKIYPVLEQPKYDPCRKFKEGDIVDYRRRYGRDYETVPDPEDYKIARVFSSEEEESGMVGVEFIKAYGGDNVCFLVPWFHLELVIPVEELNPYSIIVQPEGYHCVRIMKEKRIHSSFPFGEEECVCHTLEEAKNAAETECKRLNAEWKKLQT
jgi:hypothetical protein